MSAGYKKLNKKKQLDAKCQQAIAAAAALASDTLTLMVNVNPTRIPKNTKAILRTNNTTE